MIKRRQIRSSRTTHLPLPHELASVELMEHPEHHHRCLGVCKTSEGSQGVCQDKEEGGREQNVSGA